MPRGVQCIVALVLGATALAAGCGREAPYFAPPPPGNLEVTSDPAGAAILIDGSDTGQATPATVAGVEAGEHVVAVALPGYTVWPPSRRVNVPAGGTASVDFALALITGNLEVTSTPGGAAVLLDGYDTGRVTPATFSGLVPRDYEVAVRRAGHAATPAALTVTVTPDATASATFVLVPITGDLAVHSAPAGAVIVLDGVSTGHVTPDTLRGLAPGMHEVAVEIAGGCVWPDRRMVEVPGFGLAIADFLVPRQSGSLAVVSTPAGAAISIDGAATGRVTPHSFTCVPLGAHLVEVALAGYEPIPASRTVTVLAGRVTGAEFAFTGETGSLTVTSTPSGAAILLDGADTGEITPSTLGGIPAGAHAVSVALAGRCAWPGARTVSVTAAVPASADFALLAESGSVQVTSSPAGAEIVIDGENTGVTTPATLMCVPIGEHAVTLALPGYVSSPSAHTVTVTADQQASADFTLTLQTGSLEVTSTPAGASVILDGQNTGAVTPALLPGLTPGDHQVRVERTGYAAWPPLITRAVVAGQTASAHFTLTLLTGRLAVTSTPAGAGIVLDGIPTGQVTPDTLEALVPRTYRVTVSLPGFASNPTYRDVAVTVDALAAADFELTPITGSGARVVLLEAFSNVDCLGCPQAAAMLEAAMATPGYGLDKMLLIKYAASWPDLLDPHYQANPTANNARLSYYQNYLQGIPTVIIDGSLAGSAGVPPPLATLLSLVDAEAATDPGFSIAVAPAQTGSQVGVTVTLTATRDVQNANARLFAALLENPIEYTVPPGSEGETVFHWIMRDFVQLTPAPLPLAVGEPTVRSGSLARQPAWLVDRLHVVAFVQDVLTRSVLQAGYAAVPPLDR